MCRYDARRRAQPNPDLLPLVQQSRKVGPCCTNASRWVGRLSWLQAGCKAFALLAVIP